MAWQEAESVDLAAEGGAEVALLRDAVAASALVDDLPPQGKHASAPAWKQARTARTASSCETLITDVGGKSTRTEVRDLDGPSLRQANNGEGLRNCGGFGMHSY